MTMGYPIQDLPDRVKRLMPGADRKAFGPAGMTQAEADAKCEAESERELQKLVSSFLAIRGYFPIRSGMHRRTSTPEGTPDFLLAVKGRAVALECKSATGKLSEDQEFVRRELEGDGWTYVVVQNLGQVRAVIDDLERSTL